MISRILRTVILLLLFASLCAAPSAAAETLEPWYRVSSVSLPGNLTPGRARSEVQELTVSATQGRFLIIDPETVTPGEKVAAISIEQTPQAVMAALQTALEGFYGAGDVEVTEKPVSAGEDAEHIQRYLISFARALAFHSVKPIEAVSPYLGPPHKLRGGEKGGVAVEGEEAIEVRQLTAGRPDGYLVVTVINVGDESASFEGGSGGVPLTITDSLPEHLRAVSIEGGFGRNEGSAPCDVATVSCTISQGALAPFVEQAEMTVGVEVEPGAASGEVNTASVSGGEGFACREVSDGSGRFADSGCIREGGADGFEREATVAAPETQGSHAIVVSGAPTPFGVEDYEMRSEEIGGGLVTHAGEHPFQTTFTLNLNQDLVEGKEGQEVGVPVALAKDLTVALPPGFIGNPSAYERCSIGAFSTNTCPAASIIGVASVAYHEPIGGRKSEQVTDGVPVFNVEPQVGEPARFAFKPDETPIFIDTSVRSGEDYGVTARVQSIPQTIGFTTNTLTFWGVPGAQAHEDAHSYQCLKQLRGSEGAGPCLPVEAASPQPFLSLPGSCPRDAAGQPVALQSSIKATAWEAPGRITPPVTSEMPGMDGCGSLQFASEVLVKPDLQSGSSPSGLLVDVHIPQEEALNAQGYAPAEVRNIKVALPAGVDVSPSASDGLQACSSGPSALLAARLLANPGDQVGFEGEQELASLPGVSTLLFSSRLAGSFNAQSGVEHGELQLSEASAQSGMNTCPNASKIGTVKITSPLLPKGDVVEGAVYLAAQEANPFGSVFALYLVAEDPVSGFVFKSAGELRICHGAGEIVDGLACEGLGQLITTFKDNPQLPFENAEIHFFGGERAPLSTPVRCGTYTTSAYFEPWTNGGAVAEDLHSEYSFQINSGPNGTPCPGATLPFKPSITGGPTNVNAGAFSPFTATFSRAPGERNMQSIEAKLPPGTAAILTGVELCPEPQANEGLCGTGSLIGETTVSVGVGGEPYTVSGGKFYLTGPYNGTSGCTVGEAGCAPFGVSFDVPAKAGPFDLANTKANHPPCDCVLVRGKIEINPLTAAITITSNPSGSPDAIPTSLEGIPLEIQHINAITTRENFQFNPTNCDKMEVTGTIHTSENTVSTLGVPSQVTNCTALKFEPKFTATASGKTSKADGASLTLKVTRPSGPDSGQANFRVAKIELPKQLPSRLTTLQKACLGRVFEANPAACPATSIVGHAKVLTPILPVPLEGPAYFVSHGGEAFPSLIMVLQGYGVTLDVVSTTFINKAGVTSGTLKAVPDQPFTSFELTLPEGPHSALAANGNLCKDKLAIPTEFIAQTGQQILQSTPIQATGCPKPLTRKQKLAAALKACHHQKNHTKRAACETQAHRKYT